MANEIRKTEDKKEGGIMKKIKHLILPCLALVLAVSLVAGACAPAAPGEEADCSKVEAELAASEKKVDDLEDEVASMDKEIAALKKPAEVQRWEPSTWIPAGTIWDSGLVSVCDYINDMSDGRIEAIPSAPGAVCPVEEQLAAVDMGSTEAMMVWPGYFGGKIPICALEGDCFGTMGSVSAMRYLYEVYEGGRIYELFEEAYRKSGDVELIGHLYHQNHSILAFKDPIYRIADLEGVMLRASDNIAENLALLGAGTVWCPGPEIYTMLATGVVDGAGYGSVSDCIAMSFHEVTKYWLRTPAAPGPAAQVFIVNGSVWKTLPDDLKAIVKGAVGAGSGTLGISVLFDNEKGWKTAVDYGMEIIDWPEEDCAVWSESMRSLLDRFYEDPACAEMLGIQEQFMIEMGYWE